MRDEFIYFGEYPGAAAIRKDADRWSNYILNSLVEISLSRLGSTLASSPAHHIHHNAANSRDLTVMHEVRAFAVFYVGGVIREDHAPFYERLKGKPIFILIF